MTCMAAFCASEANTEGNKTNRRIEKDLNKHKKKVRNELRLLLLGAGESGKSTIVKQMRIIYTMGFSDVEREMVRKTIVCNMCYSMKTLVNAMDEYNCKVSDPLLQQTVRFIQDIDESDIELLSGVEFQNALSKLWGDKMIQDMFKRADVLQLYDSTAYFYENLDRIYENEYIPNDQDLLMARSKTTGIFEIKFEVDDVVFHMTDVGGQRSQRRKWIQCFADVTAIIFTVATSGYNQCLREDPTQNKLLEAITLFESIWKNRWLQKVSFILFLNKCDLLKEKILTCDLQGYFPEYAGGPSFENARRFIKDQFKEKTKCTEQRRLYPHYTIATNTNNIKKVFNDVKDIVLRFHLAQFGLV